MVTASIIAVVLLFVLAVLLKFLCVDLVAVALYYVIKKVIKIISKLTR